MSRCSLVGWLVHSVAESSDLSNGHDCQAEKQSHGPGLLPSSPLLTLLELTLPLLLPELVARLRKVMAVSVYRARHLQPWELERQKLFSLSSRLIQWERKRYRGEAAEVWQSLLLGEQRHKHTSQVLPDNPVPTHQGCSVGSLWLQGQPWISQTCNPILLMGLVPYECGNLVTEETSISSRV